MVDYNGVKSRKRKFPEKYGSSSATSKKQIKKEAEERKVFDIVCRIKTSDGISKARIARVIQPLRIQSSILKVEAITSRTVIDKTKKKKAPNKRATIKKEAKAPNGTKVSHQFCRPTVEECEYVTRALTEWHPEVLDHNNNRRMLESCGKRECLTDAIVSTMLSQNTTDANSKAAFASLKKTFPNGWKEVACPSNKDRLQAAIRVAGLASTRATRIQSMLQTVMAEHNDNPSMDYLRKMNNDEVKKELARFPGLGPKTISCVLLFALARRDEFPVDTHVFRISQRLHWLSPTQHKNRNNAYDYLNTKIPPHLKLDLHCLLVRHGKVCKDCAANRRPQFPPSHNLPCPLSIIAKWNGITPLPSIINTTKIKQEEQTSPEVVSSNFQALPPTLLETMVKTEFLPKKLKQEGQPSPDLISSNSQVKPTTLKETIPKQEDLPETPHSNDQVKNMS